jgi:integrase
MRSGELFALEWKDVEWEGRKINVSKSYNGRLKITKTTKAGYWRDIPINDDLLLLLQELRSLRGQETHVLPRLPRWQNGEAARILRTFCVGHGLPSIRLHTLRACFATQLIKNKVAPAQVMKVGGWKELKVMQRYIRLAGIEIDGATDSLKILPERDVMAQVVPLFNGGTALNFEPNAQRVPDMEDK